MGKPCGEPMVERMARGQGGAQTRLTERGRQLVGNFAVGQHKHARFGKRLNRQAGGLTRDYSLMEVRNERQRSQPVRRQRFAPEARRGERRGDARRSSRAQKDLGIAVGSAATAILNAARPGNSRTLAFLRTNLSPS